MKSNLYAVQQPLNSRFAEPNLSEPVKHDYERVELCPNCGRRVSGAYWDHPRELCLTKSKQADFMYVPYCSAPFVLSEKALQVIQDAGMTGIRTAEKIETVKFHKKSLLSKQPMAYYYIELERSRITINHEASEINYGNTNPERKICPLCQQVPATNDFMKRLELNMEAYEGWDIFHCYELGSMTFLSQRFVDLCHEHGLTNLWYSEAENIGLHDALFFMEAIDDESSIMHT